MHVSEEDQQRSYMVWDLFDSTRNELAAMLRQEDIFLEDDVDRVLIQVKSGQCRRRYVMGSSV